MATLTFNGESFTVDHAVKGTDFIHGYDAAGGLLVSFEGISDFNDFSYTGSYLAPSACLEETYNDVLYHGGSLKRPDGTAITPGDLGLATANHTHTLAALGAAAANHTHTPASLGAAELNSDGKVTANQASSTQNVRTEDYTLQLTDAGKIIISEASSAVTFTVPLNSAVAFPTGAEVEILQYGSGAVTVSPTAGVSLFSFEGSGARSLGGQYAVAALKKLSDNEWLLAGMLA